MINYRCIALFEHRIGTQNGSLFSLISSVKMQLIFKMNSSVERSILALSADYHKNPLTFQIDDVTSGSMTAPPDSAQNARLQVKALNGTSSSHDLEKEKARNK